VPFVASSLGFGLAVVCTWELKPTGFKVVPCKISVQLKSIPYQSLQKDKKQKLPMVLAYISLLIPNLQIPLNNDN